MIKIFKLVNSFINYTLLIMIEDLLKNLKLEPLESWGPEPLQRN
jgi:hypothetical protein